jgi:hypothetical protein
MQLSPAPLQALLWRAAALLRTGAAPRAKGFATMAGDAFYKEIRAAGGAYKWHCDGAWRESTSGKTVGVFNPSTRARDYEVQACTQSEVDEAFAAAKAAQRAWARTPLWQRAALLHKVAALMRDHAQPMADCLVKEIAKPSKDALTEVIRCGAGGGGLPHGGARTMASPRHRSALGGGGDRARGHGLPAAGTAPVRGAVARRQPCAAPRGWGRAESAVRGRAGPPPARPKTPTPPGRAVRAAPDLDTLRRATPPQVR